MSNATCLSSVAWPVSNMAEPARVVVVVVVVVVIILLIIIITITLTTNMAEPAA